MGKPYSEKNSLDASILTEMTLVADYKYALYGGIHGPFLINSTSRNIYPAS